VMSTGGSTRTDGARRFAGGGWAPWMHRDADASRALSTGAPTAQNASGDRH
jgi:hypothetical protein